MNKTALTATLMLTASCAVSDNTPPVFASKEPIPADWSAQEGRTEPTRNAWINDFRDPLLTKLVTEAVEHNQDLPILEARLNLARALARQARGGLFPAFDIFASTGYADSIENSAEQQTTETSGVSASWELDLWGRIRLNVRRSQFETAAAVADREGAERLLAASVAEGYFLAIGAQRQANVANATYERLNKTLGFVTVQYERGLRSGQDIALIRADVSTTEASRTAARDAARNALRSLEVLIGRYPAAQLELADFPAQPDLRPGGTPAEVLERRPDVVAAAARVAAAQAGLSSAKAERLPRISLSGTIESLASNPDAIFSPATVVWRAAGGIVAPVFRGGAIRAQIDAADARLDESVALYRATALAAFNEVEGLLDQESALRDQETALTAAGKQAGLALQYVQFRYENGDASLLDVLNIEQRVSALESAYVSLRVQRLTQYTRLSLALGGEWK